MTMKFSGFPYLVSTYHRSKFQGNLRCKGDILKKKWMIGHGITLCIEYCCIIFPFNSLSINKNFLACYTNTDSDIRQWKDLENDHSSSLTLNFLQI